MDWWSARTPHWIYKWLDKAPPLLKQLDTERGIIPLRSHFRYNITVAFGADPPAFPIHKPQLALWQAAARITEKQHRFNAGEAIPVLRLQTFGSAYAGFQERDLGSIEKGKQADLVVWEEKFCTTPVDRVKDIQAKMTIIGGRVIYQRNGSPQKGK